MFGRDALVARAGIGVVVFRVDVNRAGLGPVPAQDAARAFDVEAGKAGGGLGFEVDDDFQMRMRAKAYGGAARERGGIGVRAGLGALDERQFGFAKQRRERARAEPKKHRHRRVRQAHGQRGALQVAQLAEQLAHALAAVEQRARQGRAVQHVGGVRGLGELARGDGVHRERQLAQHRQTRSDRRGSQRGVRVRRRRDDHAVEVPLGLDRRIAVGRQLDFSGGVIRCQVQRGIKDRRLAGLRRSTRLAFRRSLAHIWRCPRIRLMRLRPRTLRTQSRFGTRLLVPRPSRQLNHQVVRTHRHRAQLGRERLRTGPIRTRNDRNAHILHARQRSQMRRLRPTPRAKKCQLNHAAQFRSTGRG